MGLYASPGVLLTQSTEPSNPSQGDLWYDTVNDLLKGFDGSNYVQIGKTSFSNATITSHSTTIGDYTKPAAPVATSSNSALSFSEDFLAYNGDQSAADTAWPTDNTTRLRVNVTNDNLAFDNESDTVQCRTYHDIGVANISETEWVMRFHVDMTSYTANTGSNQNHALKMYLSSGFANGYSPAEDSLGLWFNSFGGATKNAIESWVNLAGTTALIDTTIVPSVTDYYIQMTRTSATNFRIEIFSDSDYSVQLGSTTNQTITSGYADLRYFVVQYFCESTNGTTIGVVDDIQIASGTTTFSNIGAASNIADDSTSSYWESDAEVNPAVYVNCGSDKNILGLAIYLHENTTETQIKIRGSADETFSDAENVRTITISNLTAGAWNYIRFNLKYKKYIQVYGSSGNSKVLAISEIKYLTMTDNDLKNDEGVLEISSSDTSLGLNGV